MNPALTALFCVSKSMLFPRELLTGRILVRPSRAIIEINTPLEWARKGHDIPVEIRHGCNMISKLDKVAHKTITMSDLPHTPLNWCWKYLQTCFQEWWLPFKRKKSNQSYHVTPWINWMQYIWSLRDPLLIDFTGWENFVASHFPSYKKTATTFAVRCFLLVAAGCSF